MSIACVIIAGGKRRTLIDERILPSILPQRFDDVLVVGEHHEHQDNEYRYLHVPDMMANTNDALVKRDVGALATDADILVYLSDDHGLAKDFLSQLRLLLNNRTWDVLVPSRWCKDPTKDDMIPLNMGQNDSYCGGHAGVFRRWVIQRRPWTTMPHDRLWDLLASKEQQKMGARFVYTPMVAVEDLTPETQPWK